MRKDETTPILRMTIEQFEQAFQNEDDCKSYLAKCRWPATVTCPRCGNAATEHRKMRWHWNCYKCPKNGLNYRFSVKVGTVFEGSNMPLHHWFRVMRMVLSSNTCVSARQVFRAMNFGSYAAALTMRRKIYAAVDSAEFRRLIGYVAGGSLIVNGNPRRRSRENPHPARAALRTAGNDVNSLLNWAHSRVLNGPM